MDPLIKALKHFETLMDQSREALETIARYAQEVRVGTPLDPESWQKISSYAADRIRQLVNDLKEIAPDTLVNTRQATRALISGQEVTVDADQGRVYQGRLDQRPKP